MAKPVLWQIKISHYSEKARWALDYKGVEHERKAPLPPVHMGFAMAKTRGKAKTFPLLDLDGRTYGDSTEIIAALEERFPEPPLYPVDPEDRRRALELEEVFDEEIGPYTRRLVWHEVISDPAALDRLVGAELPAIPGSSRVAAPIIRGFVDLRFKVKSPEGAEEARQRVIAGFDRLEAELDGREYLVGDGFTVADLTAASLFYPVVSPEEGPQLPEPPASLAEFCDSLSERPGFRWVAEMFHRHRKQGAAKTAAAA